jgi:hypothetical protein
MEKQQFGMGKGNLMDGSCKATKQAQPPEPKPSDARFKRIGANLRTSRATNMSTQSPRNWKGKSSKAHLRPKHEHRNGAPLFAGPPAPGTTPYKYFAAKLPPPTH